MASGENPQAAESVGIAVDKLRYLAVMTSGMLAAAGGAYLSIGSLSLFTRDMTAGRGFIALAAVIFGNWMPFGTLAACVMFAGAQAFQIQGQVKDIGIPTELLLALAVSADTHRIGGVRQELSSAGWSGSASRRPTSRRIPPVHEPHGGQRARRGAQEIDQDILGIGGAIRHKRLVKLVRNAVERGERDCERATRARGPAEPAQQHGKRRAQRGIGRKVAGDVLQVPAAVEIR